MGQLKGQATQYTVQLVKQIKHRVSWERGGFLPGLTSGTVPLALRSRQHSCDNSSPSPPSFPTTLPSAHRLTAGTVQCYIGVKRVSVESINPTQRNVYMMPRADTGRAPSVKHVLETVCENGHLHLFKNSTGYYRL
ncbi:unnamed protein product [Leuciscus chuanchicus]